MCGGTLYPTSKVYRNNSGNGHYYKCDKCGAEVGVIENVYV